LGMFGTVRTNFCGCENELEGGLSTIMLIQELRKGYDGLRFMSLNPIIKLKVHGPRLTVNLELE